MCDLLARQENESPVRIMPPQGKYPACFVCGQPIESGQEYYKILTSWLKRHITCRRKSVGRSQPKTEDDWRRLFRVQSGSDKRRRGSGHGYSGGDGFTDL